ncbi:MAG TPA: hypothetical protein DD473_21345 [Planctomycetaceae bacterium]|nr:hypothetical protein [Planctomycetaceae bacterium]
MTSHDQSVKLSTCRELGKKISECCDKQQRKLSRQRPTRPSTLRENAMIGAEMAARSLIKELDQSPDRSTPSDENRCNQQVTKSIPDCCGKLRRESL